MKLTLKQCLLILVFTAVATFATTVIYVIFIGTLFLSNNIYVVFIGALIFAIFLVVDTIRFKYLERYLGWFAKKLKIQEKFKEYGKNES